MVNHTLSTETGRFELIGQPMVVTRGSQLPEALRSKKPIIIDNLEMEKRFRSLQRWQEARIWFFGVLAAALVAYAISRDYKIELSWHRDWKISTMDGKLILTPVERR